MIKRIALLVVLSMCCVACFPKSNTKVNNGVGERQVAWEEFKENRPEVGFPTISHEPTLLVFKGTSDLYALTNEILDKIVERTENCRVAFKLEKIRQKGGEDGFKKALNQLSRAEEKEYFTYLKSEIKALEVVFGMFTTAMELQGGITNFSLSELAMYPWDYVAVYEGVNRAKEQCEYTIRALSWMKDYSAALTRARSYKGR